MVSIIVPVYNVNEYLDSCVQSLVSQTYADIEIILIDDGSTDGSSVLCDKWKLADKRVRVFHEPNNGVAITRNIGLREAKGDKLFFLDSDDVISPTTIGDMVTFMVDSGSDIVICNYEDVDEHFKYSEWSEKSVGKKEDEHFAGRVISNDEFWRLYITAEEYSTVCGKLFNAVVFNDIAFPSGKINEDAAVFWRITDKRKIAIIEAKFYFRRMREGSIMHTPFGLKNLFLLEVYLDMYEYLKNNDELSSKTKYNAIKFNFDIVLDLLAKAFTRYKRTDDIYILAMKQYKQYRQVARYLGDSYPADCRKVTVRIKMFLFLHFRHLFFELREKALLAKGIK